jgi:methylenetetrahydrofolate reductase (NADPH)
MSFTEKLDSNKFIITSEVQVSVETDSNGMIDGLKKIKGRIDGLIVSEVEIEGVACDSLSVCGTLRENGYDPLFETTTREKNRIELQSQLIKASEAGIKNLLTFTRDYRLTGDGLNEMMFFHVDAGKLFSVLDHLKDGVDVKGKDLAKPLGFSVGAGIDASWGRKIPDLELKEMEHMAKMGTKFFLTTPVFDLEEFHQFYKRVKQFGIPIIAEVILIRSAGMGNLFNRYMRPNLVPQALIQRLLKAPDKEKASIEIFTELVKGLREFCHGIHIVPFGAEDRVGSYLSAVRK